MKIKFKIEHSEWIVIKGNRNESVYSNIINSLKSFIREGWCDVILTQGDENISKLEIDVDSNELIEKEL